MVVQTIPKQKIPQALMPDQSQNTLQRLTGLREQLEKQEQTQQTPITVRHYHCDHLGTPLALTDQNQQIVWAARLDPWGNVEQEFNPHDIDQAIRLPGQHHDKETGLYYNRHRYYDPSIGAYVNQDPIGLEGGINKYVYPINPESTSDPLGLREIAPRAGPPRRGGVSWGNWCGGGWSGGFKTTVILQDSKPPIDSLDACCMVHDYCYAEREKKSKGPGGCDKACDTIAKDECDKAMVDCVKRLPANTKDWPMPSTKLIYGKPMHNMEADEFRSRLLMLFDGDFLQNKLTP